MYVYVSIYTLSLFLYIYIYTYIYICMYMYIYIYIDHHSHLLAFFIHSQSRNPRIGHSHHQADHSHLHSHRVFTGARGTRGADVRAAPASAARGRLPGARDAAPLATAARCTRSGMQVRISTYIVCGGEKGQPNHPRRLLLRIVSKIIVPKRDAAPLTTAARCTRSGMQVHIYIHIYIYIYNTAMRSSRLSIRCPKTPFTQSPPVALPNHPLLLLPLQQTRRRQRLSGLAAARPPARLAAPRLAAAAVNRWRGRPTHGTGARVDESAARRAARGRVQAWRRAEPSGGTGGFDTGGGNTGGGPGEP